LFVATRIPDPTDVLVGVIAAVVGLKLGWWLWEERQTAKTKKIEPHHRAAP
jgi:hypothetical protein